MVKNTNDKTPEKGATTVKGMREQLRNEYRWHLEGQYARHIYKPKQPKPKPATTPVKEKKPAVSTTTSNTPGIDDNSFGIRLDRSWMTKPPITANNLTTDQMFNYLDEVFHRRPSYNGMFTYGGHPDFVKKEEKPTELNVRYSEKLSTLIGSEIKLSNINKSTSEITIYNAGHFIGRLNMKKINNCCALGLLHNFKFSQLNEDMVSLFLEYIIACVSDWRIHGITNRNANSVANAFSSLIAADTATSRLAKVLDKDKNWRKVDQTYNIKTGKTINTYMRTFDHNNAKELQKD